MNVLEEEKKANSTFHTEVRAALDAMKARREEADRSTRHGGEFHLLGCLPLRAKSVRDRAQVFDPMVY